MFGFIPIGGPVLSHLAQAPSIYYSATGRWCWAAHGHWWDCWRETYCGFETGLIVVSK